MLKNKIKIMAAIKDVNLLDISNTTGINKDTLSRLANNKLDGINVSVLDKLCTYFNCQPGNLYEIVKKENGEFI